MKSFTAALAITSTLLVSPGWADETLFLLERKIPLGEVRGRIDHLAVDLARNRLFVAELENDTVAVIDLNAHKVMQVISGLNKPQGLGYHASTDTLYVANGGDGTAAIFRGDDYREIARIPLGADADNVRVDAVGNRVYVAYGHGALAVIDPTSRNKIADIELKAHSESLRNSGRFPCKTALQLQTSTCAPTQTTCSWTQNASASTSVAGMAIWMFSIPGRMPIVAYITSQRLRERE